jgi:acetate---CoA ligase (ADP-forming)
MTDNNHPALRTVRPTAATPAGGPGPADGDRPTAGPVAGPPRAGPVPAGPGPVPGRPAPPGPPGPGERPAVAAMLEARSVALVGASPRPGSLGERMVAEVTRSPAAPRVYLVNPRHAQVAGRPCHGSLGELPEPVDLVLLAVPDAALEEQLARAARRGDRSAVIFGSAHELPGGPPGLRGRLAATARAAGLAVCGAGCMGFVNVSYGLRAVGYLEPDPLPSGPVALVTHSGSAFSALLRTHRQLGFTVAVSSGQELVTTAAQYAEYALSLPRTRVLALILEAMRDPARLRTVLATAAQRDIPVVLLTAGRSAGGRAMVSAHSGALAASDGGWEALAGAYGVHRVGDLAELTDTLELFAAGRRAASPARPAGPVSPASPPSPLGPGRPPGLDGRPGIATVHDSGLERAHVADLADELGVPFAAISPATRERLAGLLEPGLAPENPLDMWGTGARAREQLAGSLAALAADPAVAAVALAVDLVHEFDGDQSYPLAVLDAARQTAKPVAVLSNVPSAIDPEVAAGLRRAGVPVLEGARSGLLALRHLLDQAARPARRPGGGPPPVDAARRDRWRRVIAAGAARGTRLHQLLGDYRIAVARSRAAGSSGQALAAAGAIGYPVVLKTDEPGIAHKSDAGGVVLGIPDPAGLRAAYQDLAERLGARVLVSEAIPAGTELSLGIATDRDLGPLVVVGAGGVLVELLADRVVALPPVSPAQAREMIGRLRAAALLAGVRGQPPADLAAVAAAVSGVAQIAVELGDVLEALDVNPLICGPGGAIAVDALAIPRSPAP